MDKKSLTERDICTKFITPALETSGWDLLLQVREEFPLTAGRIIVRGKVHARAKNKRADYVLYYKPNIPIAVLEAKDNNHTVGAGMQQGLGYSSLLQVPFTFSSNGDGFLFHNALAIDGHVERELALDEFPSPDAVWQLWAASRAFSADQQALVTQDYYSDGGSRSPR
jgi:type I restriction enzyme R subunit